MVNTAHSIIHGYTQNYPQFGIEDEFSTESNLTVYNLTWVQDGLACIFDETIGEFVTTSLFKIFIFIMYSIIFAIALTGNGLVCFVVYTSPGMKTVTNYFIVNLAIGDILMTVLCVPFSFVPVLVLRYWPFGSIMCRVVNYTQAVSVMVSAYTMLAISIDRYIAIVQPLKPRLSKAAAKVVVLAVWAGAAATATPIGVVAQLHKPSMWHVACNVDICGEIWSDATTSEHYSYALLILQFALPLSALVVTYVRIAYVVWAERTPGEAQSERDVRMQNSKRKMIKMMVAVVVVFIVCWLPLNIFIMLWVLNSESEAWHAWPGMPYVWFACHWLAMSHTCYNPIIYCYMNSKYRHGFKQVLDHIICIKLNPSNRSCQRSSMCEGIPMSELMGVKAQGRRVTVSKIPISRTNEECKCMRCIGIRSEKIIRTDSVSQRIPPAQPIRCE
ncbi:PREDICTED: neuropeptide Y receptor-like [Papilio polytes]|uniref:neuropeptide Y receptor-like n=1 Tax=Papilio polytes TaxID=76194 RepID=UPI0006762160|nr:PREDICTED: neuropeptide Y receptor-like [Papilio polytes]